MMFNIESTSRTPKRRPRGPQEAPKRPPRGLQKASKRPPEGPRGPQEAVKMLPNEPPKHLKDNFIQCHIIQLIHICIVIINIVFCPYFVACLLSYLLTVISLIILRIVVLIILLFMSLMTLHTRIQTYYLAYFLS